MWEQIGFSFGFGVVSSIGICLASCTPILLAYLISSEKEPKKFVGWMFLFLFIRFLSFFAVSMLILMLGRLAIDFIKEFEFVFRIIGGAMISVAGILIFLDIGSRVRFFKAKSKGFAIAALLFGIKPCLPHLAIWGYLLTVVAAPMIEGYQGAVQTMFVAALIAISFSVGENIVPIVLGIMGSKTIKHFQGKAFKLVTKACGAVLVLLGIVFVFYENIAPHIARILRF